MYRALDELQGLLREKNNRFALIMWISLKWLKICTGLDAGTIKSVGANKLESRCDMSCKYCDEVMCDREKTLCNGCAVEKAVLADRENRKDKEDERSKHN